MAAIGRPLGFSTFDNIEPFTLFKIARKLFYMSKLQNNQKNINNYEFLIIFNQKIERLTENCIFPNFLSGWHHLISVKNLFIIEE